MADDSYSELTVGSKPLSTLRVIDLKTELEKRSLPKSGTKKELLERLKRQLQLETLQQKANQNADQVPNLSLQDDALVSQNEVVKQYLAGQQKIYELQKEARRKIERDDAHRASDTEASSSQDEGCSTREAEESQRKDVITKLVSTPTEVDSPKERSLPSQEKEEEVTAPKRSHKVTAPKSSEEVTAPKSSEAKKSEANQKEDPVTKELQDVHQTDSSSVEQKQEEPDQSSANAETSCDTETNETVEKVQSEPVSQDNTNPHQDSASLLVTEEPEEENRDEIAAAVGSICIERDTPMEDSECSPLQSNQPSFIEQRTEMEQIHEVDSIQEGQSTATHKRSPLREKDDTVPDADESVVSSSDGLEGHCVPQPTVEQSEEGMDVADETAEACRVITENYLEQPIPKEEPAQQQEPQREEEGSSGSSEAPASPDNTTRPTKKESSSSEEENEKEEEGEKKEPEPPQSTEQKEAQPAQNGVLPDGGDSQKDGHILDLHPGDMEIGYSSVRSSEDSVQEPDEKNHSQNNLPSEPPQQPQQFQPRNISNRKLSLSGSRDAKNSKKEEEENKPQRKRRWGSLTKSSKSTPSISTESLKDLIPDYKPQLTTLSVLPEETPPKDSPSSFSTTTQSAADASVEDSSQEPPEKTIAGDRVSESNSKPEPVRVVQLERRTSSNSVPNDKLSTATLSAPPAATPVPHKGVSILKEEVELKVTTTGPRPQSPAKNPVSRILFIRNLVRPFTLPQLKEMLARTGSVVPDAFWIDKIKSKCYVMYETEEEAVTTRASLHGSRWPTSNPKTLLVDYSTEDELNFHKQLGESPGLPPPMVPTGPGSGITGNQRGPGDPQRIEEHFPHSHRLAKNMTVVVSQNVPATPTGSRTSTSRQHSSSREESSEKSRGASGETRQSRPLPIREWDRDKLSQDGGHSHHSHHHSHHRETVKPSRSSDGQQSEPTQAATSDRERKERTSRKEKKELSKKKVEEPPGKLLDDLFRKTKAMPCIYWLPLTESALAQREMEKKQWEVEREKRREKRQETGLGGREGSSSGERKARPNREALKPLPPPTLTGGNMAPLKGREFSSGRSRSPAGRRR